MVLWEIQNFDFGAVSDDDFVLRKKREPFPVVSYSMPGLGKQDEFISVRYSFFAPPPPSSSFPESLTRHITHT